MIQIGKFPALKKYRLRGACNGFLFFGHITNVECKPKLLINPLTKEIWIWPSTPDLLPDTSVYGFGFDSSIKTYKMVQINAIDYHGETRTWTMKARVYDFEKRSWRTCKAPPPFHTHRPDYNLPFAFGPCPIFVCASGAVNWILDRFSSSGFDGREILSFDLTEEEFSLIPIPNVSLRWGYAMEMPMHGLEGSLALVDYPNDGHIDVWVLEDRARREWTRKYRIRTPWAACTCSVVGPYGSDKLILRHWRDGELMTYDVNKDQFAKCGAEEGRAARASTGVPTSLFCATLSLHSL
ncbi:hypothetical protein BT93_K1563 [Corymbia citriodora subsp. variegata]|nr:hypothetical protein BT93_K1563 [Corymbia citriodora subsp. variegata]